MSSKISNSDIKAIVNDTFKTALPILEERLNEAITSAEKNHNSTIGVATKQAIINVSSAIYYMSTETTVSLIANLLNEKLN